MVLKDYEIDFKSGNSLGSVLQGGISLIYTYHTSNSTLNVTIPADVTINSNKNHTLFVATGGTWGVAHINSDMSPATYSGAFSGNITAITYDSTTRTYSISGVGTSWTSGFAIFVN